MRRWKWRYCLNQLMDDYSDDHVWLCSTKKRNIRLTDCTFVYFPGLQHPYTFLTNSPDAWGDVCWVLGRGLWVWGPNRPQCLQATSMVTWCGNTAAARPGMRYQVCIGACYLTRGPDHNVTLSQWESPPQSRSHFIETQVFIHKHTKLST